MIWLALTAPANVASAAVIGLDAVHGTTDFKLTTGSHFNSFRDEIVSQGNTIVPVSSFTESSLAELDAVFLKMNFTNALSGSSPYSTSDIAAIHTFASQRAVFLSDSSLWADAGDGSDRPIGSGDNRKLLDNVLAYVGTGHAAVFLADAGTGSDVPNFNALVAAYGVTYAATATDGSGRTVSGFVPHAITDGITQVGVDFQRPMTLTAPALDLTSGPGQDNILAVAPEPCALQGVVAAHVMTLLRRGRRGRRDN
jgi:hypothetical protein